MSDSHRQSAFPGHSTLENKDLAEREDKLTRLFVEFFDTLAPVLNGLPRGSRQLVIVRKLRGVEFQIRLTPKGDSE